MIYRGTTAGGESSTPVGTVRGTATTFTDTGLRNGTTYFYNVAASNRVGVSPDSNEVSVTPRGTGAARPAGAATSPGFAGTAAFCGTVYYFAVTRASTEGAGPCGSSGRPPAARRSPAA
jgi:hypothetical protein